MRRLSPSAACGLAILWAAWSAPASAGTLQVNPVLLEISAERRTASVTVRNAETAPVAIRAYALAWRQADGEDVYEETAELIVSPPIFTVAPGATQLVRVGPRSASAEPRAYRLIIEEVPEAAPEGGIRVALRLNLPLYKRIAAGAPAHLRWSARRQADGGWVIEAANSGPGYVRLDADLARAATGARYEDSVYFGTVLPGATRRWRVGPGLRIEDRTQFERLTGMQGHAAAVQGSD